jgi:Piwi domain
MANISLNFIAFKNQDFGITIYRKEQVGNEFYENSSYYSLPNEDGKNTQYEIKFENQAGFEEYKLPNYFQTNLISKSIFDKLILGLSKEDYLIKRDSDNNRKIHFIIENHLKGKKCVWIQPYFLKSRQTWGLLLNYNFVVSVDLEGKDKFKLDRDIQIASGSLNDKGGSNTDYYLFKHNYISKFIKEYLPIVNTILQDNLESSLLKLDSSLLSPKVYIFGNNTKNYSSYLGITRNPPLEEITEDTFFYFIYKKSDRDIAVSLLRGLRGETNPTTFSGMEKLFRLNFSNDRIKGVAIESFTPEIIDSEIISIKKLGENVIPIIITNSKKDGEDDQLYYWLKHKFTNKGIPCQVVTKELIRNDYSIKYSLSNIGLQIFAKAGGKPWKMKPATNEYLIIGIGQSYNIEKSEDGNIIEKNITYSVLTDSSGLFKDIQVLGEGVETDDNYYKQLVINISNIINNSGYNKVAIHVPFRMSKEKVLEKVVAKIPSNIELSVLVINDKNDYFGFDYNNNGLVPFESTYIKLASDEFLVWFEGLQFNNPKINKRFGNPLLIKFWFSNNKELFNDFRYKENLLQDCINLSGANWRGFKAKQLPVSIFYCQRIAEFIAKFRQYELNHIDINNLKPWFL